MSLGSTHKNNIIKSINLLKSADAIIVFAGAGMSVDSGIEAFRGEGGLWTKSVVFEGKEFDYHKLMENESKKHSQICEYIASLKPQKRKLTINTLMM